MELLNDLLKTNPTTTTIDIEFRFGKTNSKLYKKN